jgi:hypothetical protein
MHFVMGGRGRRGFNVICEDDDRGQAMAATYEKMRRDRVSPPLNAVGDFVRYPFVFTYGYKPVIRFEWLDYRGSALEDGASAADRRALRTQLLASSAIVICVSGEHLKEELTEEAADDVAADIGIRGISQFLEEVHETNGIGPAALFPVLLLITKADLCIHRGQKALVADVKQLFPTLFKEAPTGWHVMVCPVMLGRNIGSADNLTGGTIRPEYVHWPIVFAIHAQKHREKSDLMKDAASKARTRSELEDQFFLFRWMDKDDIDRLGRERDEAIERAVAIDAELEILASEIGSSDIYINGKRPDDFDNDEEAAS